ncbi:MAG: DUF58 domain-containing protein [Myxococcales bacterium]|nr:DUF58 domain-containing protein [Myxococcales bacterium]
MADSATGTAALPATRPRRKRARAGRRYFKTTREGKAFIGVTGGVGLAAINTGNNLLFLIFGFMLSLIVLSGILSEIVLKNVRISRRLPRRAFAGTTCLVEIALENRKERAPSYSLEIEDQAEDLPTERRCYFLKVAAQSEQVASYRRTPARRGYLKLSGFRVATRYPFGIIEKWRVIEAPGEMLIYPALLRDDGLDADERSVGAESTTTRIGVGTEVAGLRNYESGDEARAIHWRRTAALGRLVVHEKHRDASTHLTLVLDNARPEEAPRTWDAGFERAISRVAAICVDSTSRDLSVDVVVRGRRSPTVMAGNPADPILQFLALLESVPAEEAPPLAHIGRGARVLEVAITPEGKGGNGRDREVAE